MIAPVSLGSRARHGLTPLVLSAALLAGCGDGGSGEERDYDAGPEQHAFEDELEAMAGVDDAKVEREAFDTDYYGEEIVVDMVSDATAEQVTAVLDALRQHERDGEGWPQDSKVTLGAGTTSRAGDDFAPDAAPGIFGSTRDHGANERMAAMLVNGAALLPDHNIVVVAPQQWSVFGAVEGTDPTVGVRGVVDAVRKEPLLADSAHGSISVAAGDRTASLDLWRGLRPSLLEDWAAVAEAFEHDAVRSVSLGGTSIWITIRLPHDVGPRGLTTDAYGEQLWPLIHGELDVLAGMGPRSTLEVTNQYAFGDEAEGGGYQEDRFVSVTLGRPARNDRNGRAWNAEATDYLDQVLATR